MEIVVVFVVVVVVVVVVPLEYVSGVVSSGGLVVEPDGLEVIT